MHHFCCFWFLEFHRNINEELVPEPFSSSTVWGSSAKTRLLTLLLECNAFTPVREDVRVLTFVMGEEVMSERGSGTVVTVARAQRGAELQHSCQMLRQRGGWRNKGVGRGTGQKEARNGKMSKGEGK